MPHWGEVEIDEFAVFPIGKFRK